MHKSKKSYKVLVKTSFNIFIIYSGCSYDMLQYKASYNSIGAQ